MNIQGKVWGDTSLLFNKNNVEVHYVHIKKGGYCSVHLHKHKYNHFVVLAGKLKVTISKDYSKSILEDVSILNANQECTVNPGDYHQFEALEDTIALEIYWVSLNENDIERKTVGGAKDAAQTTPKNDSEQFKQERQHTGNNSAYRDTFRSMPQKDFEQTQREFETINGKPDIMYGRYHDAASDRAAILQSDK